MDETSMLFWYPKIKSLPIPQPKTEILEIGDEMTSSEFLINNKLNDYKDEIEKIADKLNYPLFVRTDQASAKHGWEKTCFVKTKENLMANIERTIEFGFLADILGLDATALVFREYIEMDSKYTAFYGKMPVCPERRYFIKDGKIICHHEYWITDAIANPSVENWEELSNEMNKETQSEITTLSSCAQKVANIMPDFWSVDFCLSKSKTWYLIDMAKGERSWHKKECVNSWMTKKS